MLSWALSFFIVSIIAAVFGFAIGVEVAKILFVVFVVLFLVACVAGLLSHPGQRKPSLKEKVASLEEKLEELRTRLEKTEERCRPIAFTVRGENSCYESAVPIRKAINLLLTKIGLQLDLIPAVPEKKSEVVIVKAKRPY